MNAEQRMSETCEAGLCILCGELPRMRNTPHTPILCWKCRADQLKKRHAREAFLSRQRRMTWADFVKMLHRYDFLAGLEFEWAYGLYEKYGRHLGIGGGITDIYDLEYEFNSHTCQGNPGQIPDHDFEP